MNSKDVDNIAKAVLDSGNGICWIDDRQIAVLHICKLIGAQNEAPHVRVHASPIGAAPDAA